MLIKNNSGFALVFVLVSLLALSSLLLKTFESSSSLSANAKNLHQEYVVDGISKQALPVIYSMMQSQKHHSLLQNKGSISVYDGKIIISMSPCNSRLNFNALHKNKEVKERYKKAFQALFKNRSVQRPQLDQLYFWIGLGKDKNSQNNQYKNKDYSPKKGRLSSPEEIVLVPGFENISEKWIRSMYTVWGTDASSININYSSKEVVLSLLPELEQYWEGIQKYRENNSFVSIDQLITEIGVDVSTYQMIMEFITCDFEYVNVSVLIKQGVWSEKHRFIVKYDGFSSEDPYSLVAHDIIDRRLSLSSLTLHSSL